MAVASSERKTAAASQKDVTVTTAAKRTQEAAQARRARAAFFLSSALIAVVAFGLGVQHAAKDERVTATVNEAITGGMQRINTTLVNTFNKSLDAIVDEIADKLPNVSLKLGAEVRLRPGQIAARAGLRARHPVLIVPGFVTSGLELWAGQPCAQAYFRQRLWGTLSMAQTLLADRACWMRHMSLDPVTGTDPPGIKLRAARALEAIDFFVPGYWVFSKMVQSLADVGMDNNDLVAMPHDWRLPIPMLEDRDAWFTRVKEEAELQFHKAGGTKVVLVSHSYGAVVTFAFLTWVEEQQAGWVDKYLESWANLAGPLLGLPKAIAPLLSGESRETADMVTGLSFLMERYLSKSMRAAVIRTWGSMMAMLPVGGTKVWGNTSGAPDDTANVTAAGRTMGGMVARVTSGSEELEAAVEKNDTSSLNMDMLKLLQTTLANWNLGWDQENSSSQNQSTSGNGSSDIGSSSSSSEVDKLPEKVKFLDVEAAIQTVALTAGLQFAENVKRWSSLGHLLDGVIATLKEQQQNSSSKGEQDPGPQQQQQEVAGTGGSTTVLPGGDPESGSGEQGSNAAERQAQVDTSRLTGKLRRKPVGTAAVHVPDVTQVPLPKAPNFKIYCIYGVGTPTERGYHYLKTDTANTTEWSINNLLSDPSSGLESGVQLSDGDGTVPLLSMGALCAGGWRTKRLNPSGLPVIIREYMNNPWPVYKDPRGGPGASTHVEILGHDGVLMDVLQLAAGNTSALPEQLVTDVQGIANRIPWDEM